MNSTVAAVKNRVSRRIERERHSLFDLSARIHSHPELAFGERRASGWLADYCESLGFEVERSAYGLDTAFAARHGEGRPRVAVLCEYDALPGIGHACGHNIIAAAGVGAAAGLAEVIEETGGSVVVLGTPAEEKGGGKILMAGEGAFENVDVAMMIHPAGMELVSMNVLAVSAVEAEYRGRAAHAAAAPHRGVNALDALVSAYNSIAQLRQHIAPDERIHGIITDGGQAPNVVPERACGLFYVRAATDRALATLKERVLACFQAGALATGAQVKISTLGNDYSDMWTNLPLADAYARNLLAIDRPAALPAETIGAVTGSTDMGNVSKLVPSIHPMLALSPPEVALHTKEFAEYASSDAANRVILDGAKLLAMTGVDVLSDTGVLAAAQASFAADVADHRSADSLD